MNSEELYGKCKAPREYQCDCESKIIDEFKKKYLALRPVHVGRGRINFTGNRTPFFYVQYFREEDYIYSYDQLQMKDAYGGYVHNPTPGVEVFYFPFCPFCGKETREVK